MPRRARARARVAYRFAVCDSFRRYVFRNAALIGVFTYFGCTLSLSGSYHVVEPDAISQPVPMSFMACLHAQAQQAREAAAAPATAAAAASAPAARPRPPRIMIAGGEKSGACILDQALHPLLFLFCFSLLILLRRTLLKIPRAFCRVLMLLSRQDIRCQDSGQLRRPHRPKTSASFYLSFVCAACAEIVPG